MSVFLSINKKTFKHAEMRRKRAGNPNGLHREIYTAIEISIGIVCEIGPRKGCPMMTAYPEPISPTTWWRHQMEPFPRHWPLCGEFTGPSEFPAQRPVARSFDVFFDLRLNKRLSKQPWGWWFETPPWSLWRQSNEFYLSEIRTWIINDIQ